MKVPLVKTTTYGLKSFRYYAATHLNHLRKETRCSKSLNAFKSNLNILPNLVFKSLSFLMLLALVLI